jgi:hypothetical protein
VRPARSAEYAGRLTSCFPWSDGNGTAIFTQSGATARKFERGVEAGQIGIKCVP